MRIGFCARDITPEPGITLSGFVARQDQPSEAVADPLEVRALAFEAGGRAALVLVFDLLGLGPELTGEIEAAAGLLVGSADRLILCCTHTHSAPATVRLIGCGTPDPRYWRRVVAEARAAARGALAALQPATLQVATETVRGVSYNRRAVLADRRVVMAQHPGAPAIKTGPTLERMVLARFAGDVGQPITGIAQWAAHACVMCTPEISADFPGELSTHCRRSTRCRPVCSSGSGQLDMPHLPRHAIQCCPEAGWQRK